MKVTKIMIDLLKLIDKKKINDIRYGEDEDYVYLTLDCFRMFKIDNQLFTIDLQKALPHVCPFNNPQSFFDVDKNMVPGVKTSELRSIVTNGKKVTMVKIASEKSHVFIDEAYLKEFDDNCTFKIGASTHPVFVYESDEIVGLILPIYIKEENDD